jgi:hypothetical protein
MQAHWLRELRALSVLSVLTGCAADAAPASTAIESTAPDEPAAAPIAGSTGSAGTKPSVSRPTPAAGSGTVSGGASGMTASPPVMPPATVSGGAGASGAAGATMNSSAAGSAGAAGQAAAGSGGQDAAAGAPAETPREDLGAGDGSDVVTIGDSWMSFFANGGGIEAGLRSASMQPYRNHGVAGTMLLDEVIPNQYAAAKRDNPDIKTVIMTGGGNDLLLTGMSGGGTCSAGCMSTIDKVAMRLEMLWQEMGDDGVQDIVYIEYSQGGDNSAGVGYGHTKLVPLCEAAAPVRCHLLHSDDFIMMMLLDGVHPTADGCTKLGKAVYELMEREGMRR